MLISSASPLSNATNGRTNERVVAGQPKIRFSNGVPVLGQNLSENDPNLILAVGPIRQTHPLLVVHHLEFDCGIIDRELQRAGLVYTDVWHRIAQSGMCTMDPYIGAWLRRCCGEEVWPGSSKNTLRLKDMVTLIAPASAHLMASAHTAGADAQMHVAVYFACLKLAGID